MAVSGDRRARRDLGHRRHALKSCAGNIAALKFRKLCRGLLGAPDGDHRQDARASIGVCDKNVEPFEDVTEPRPQGSDTTSAASSGVRGSASCRSRLGFRPFLHAFHFYVAHHMTGM